MSLIANIKELFSKRTAPNTEYGNLTPLYGVRGKHGGIVVTYENALHLSACFACVRVIAEDVAKLPWNVYSRQGEKRIRMDGSNLQRILNSRPNPEMGSFAFRETMMSWVLTWGNAYAEIERDLANRPIALWPISPDRVDPKRVNGRIIYEVSNQTGDPTYLEQSDIYHIHGIGFDGLVGYSMIGLAAESIGFGMAAEQYGAGFYGNNTHPGLALKLPTAISDPALKRLQEQINKRKGSKNAFEGMILEEGLDFAKPNMSQVDAEYVETRRQIIEEICRWWRVPPHKVQELARAHFANVENLNINYATDTLMPWIKRLEEEADYKLISNRSQSSYTRIAIQALMRGDSDARSKYYKEMFNMGAFSQNKILELEDMDPIGPEGDEHYIQVNMTTLKNIVKQAENPNPQEVVTPAVENLAARFLDEDLRNAKGAKERYSKTEFCEWIDIKNQKLKNKRLKAINDLRPTLAAALRRDIDPDVVLNIYSDYARKQIISYYDNGKTDYEFVKNAFVGAIV